MLCQTYINTFHYLTITLSCHSNYVFKYLNEGHKQFLFIHDWSIQVHNNTAMRHHCFHFSWSSDYHPHLNHNHHHLSYHEHFVSFISYYNQKCQLWFLAVCSITPMNDGFSNITGVAMRLAVKKTVACDRKISRWSRFTKLKKGWSHHYPGSHAPLSNYMESLILLKCTSCIQQKVLV